MMQPVTINITIHITPDGGVKVESAPVEEKPVANCNIGFQTYGPYIEEE